MGQGQTQLDRVVPEAAGVGQVDAGLGLAPGEIVGPLRPRDLGCQVATAELDFDVAGVGGLLA